MKFIKSMLRAENKEGEASGGKIPEPKGQPASGTPPSGEGSEPEGDKFDELGYEKVPKVPGDPKAEGKPDDKLKPPPADEEIKDPASGYGDEPPKIEDEEKVEPPKEESIDLGYELKVEGLPEPEVKKLKEFAKKHGVSKEIAQAYANQRMEEHKAFVASQTAAEKELKAAVSRQRATWHQELKADPVFGGENFAQNIKRAEKVLEEFMPSTKKVLTERRSMLPPWVMRDLAKMGEHLFSAPKLVQGEVSQPDADKEAKDDSLDFYN